MVIKMNERERALPPAVRLAMTHEVSSWINALEPAGLADAHGLPPEQGEQLAQLLIEMAAELDAEVWRHEFNQ